MPSVTVFEIGGLAGERTLAPGAAHAIELDFTQWLCLDPPGTDVGHGQFACQLRTGAFDHSATLAAHADAVWDTIATADSAIEVRAALVASRHNRANPAGLAGAVEHR